MHVRTSTQLVFLLPRAQLQRNAHIHRQDTGIKAQHLAALTWTTPWRKHPPRGSQARSLGQPASPHRPLWTALQRAQACPGAATESSGAAPPPLPQKPVQHCLVLPWFLVETFSFELKHAGEETRTATQQERTGLRGTVGV